MIVYGESLVLANTKPGRLCFDNIVPGSLSVRSTYERNMKNTIIYREGRDYIVDTEQGTIARTADSRIPDFGTNVLYAQKEFDHTKFPGYGNHAFFVWVDYDTKKVRPLAVESDQSEFLAGTRKRLEAGGPFGILVYGDSISTGCEASRERLQFYHRYTDALKRRFPAAEINIENGATGGDSTIQGLERLDAKVLTRKPGLVLMGFGMNDHNVGSVPVGRFCENLIAMAHSIRERTGAEVLMYSAFPPNPDWKFSSHRMEEYAEATRRAAAESGCAYADVYSIWTEVLKRKDFPSLLGNNINHPNDFGHYLYLTALLAVEF